VAHGRRASALQRDCLLSRVLQKVPVGAILFVRLQNRSRSLGQLRTSLPLAKPHTEAGCLVSVVALMVAIGGGKCSSGPGPRVTPV